MHLCECTRAHTTPTPRPLEPAVCWRAPGWFPHFSYYEYCPVNTGVCEPFWISASEYSEYKPRSRPAGECGESSRFFNELHSGFCSDCTDLHPHQQCRRVPFAPDPPQHLLFVDFLTFWDRYEVIPHCGFDSHSLVIRMLSIFLEPVGHLSRVVKCSTLLPDFWLNNIFYLILSCMNYLWLWILATCQFHHSQIFSAVLQVIFLSSW